MKYIIKEDKIDMLMAEYVNSWIDAKRLIEFDRFIVLENFNGEENNEMVRRAPIHVRRPS